MLEAKYTVGKLLITAVPGWLDVTREIQEPLAPFTLARPDGTGAIQFSAAEYCEGAVPRITLEELKRLLADFALSRELGSGFDAQEQESLLMIYGASFNIGLQFIRVWYCSDGRNIALVTYVCQKGREGAELPDCEKMVLAMEFR